MLTRPTLQVLVVGAGIAGSASVLALASGTGSDGWTG
jgi:succinate dehydrogenase/fumarate reductase flavoprotein subunit